MGMVKVSNTSAKADNPFFCVVLILHLANSLSSVPGSRGAQWKVMPLLAKVFHLWGKFCY